MQPIKITVFRLGLYFVINIPVKKDVTVKVREVAVDIQPDVEYLTLLPVISRR